MQINLPVTQREYELSEGEQLVSTTDTSGTITHCNPAFVRTSGFEYDELIGQPHHVIRHPDMPRAAFKDMWRTIGSGQPWTGMVKNRRKNGDHYWVQANVTPIMQDGKPSGYMSVRIKPSRAQVAAAEDLYKTLNAQHDRARPRFSLQGGLVQQRGPAAWPARLARAPLSMRLGGAIAAVAVLAILPDALQWQGAQAIGARMAILTIGLGGAFAWFSARLNAGMREAVRFAGELSSCNLSGRVRTDFPEPIGALMRRLSQIQINLRAVVGDVRSEIGGFTTSAKEIAQGSLDLSSRTESQASSLEQTAASMEQLSGTVRQTAERAAHGSVQSATSIQAVERGEEAVHQAQVAMDAIEQSSRKISSITSVIEGIAFQTNILALNAAVEAARAGEQGRGFAVVATEVRALAQRSATAAKEIQQLIAEAAQCIGQGGERIKGAGTTLKAVIASVAETGSMMTQITDATREQSIGIAQINEAVVQLDTVTQQNAALVEESAASAGALSQSATTLEKSVAVFQMPRTERPRSTEQYLPSPRDAHRVKVQVRNHEPRRLNLA
ncbi:PAS domain-containing methyl-accepting chemotaxis protein [Pseudorhodoferax sp. Leaf267]|uniref:methyl-accepting chemotaxis protein n=1 Tax=Pseudorhodoferax sp. Leaf267 TaxID=1736316 RepID=UPI0009E9A7AF|nr:PAS domain-containing methyl-accepting chemotaxis protein [Pseudorhodoferax sp. Leaf267]